MREKRKKNIGWHTGIENKLIRLLTDLINKTLDITAFADERILFLIKMHGLRAESRRRSRNIIVNIIFC